MGLSTVKRLNLTHYIVLLCAIVVSGSFASSANAQADQQDEIRYVQEAVKILYDQDPNQAFTVRELLDDGYKMCKEVADANRDPLGNLAQEAIRSGLGVGENSSEDNSEMMRISERYLCPDR
ncbi:hypothetical protein [Crocosphaera sp. Alani8]|uniref:hypothetical protein n=1 Tax=Crocosphaera sp. Alani8 TaxID=3038952 RepID=UPI00313F214C